MGCKVFAGGALSLFSFLISFYVFWCVRLHAIIAAPTTKCFGSKFIATAATKRFGSKFIATAATKRFRSKFIAAHDREAL
jgi:hypothetical protein